MPGLLPAGGGPAALFDPTIGKLALESARALLGHVNPETGLALRDDPVLAWVTLAGEISLFNLIDTPDALPPPYAKALHDAGGEEPGRRRAAVLGIGRVGPLQADGRRAAEGRAARADRRGLALAARARVQRRPGRARAGPDRRPALLGPARLGLSREALAALEPPDGGLAALAAIKRRPDRPYVVGQWCNQTHGAWSYPHEAADQLLGVYTGMAGDWDALVRRGIFVYPVTWGEGPAGTVGGEDIFQIAEVVNGSPHIYALWPHAASLFLRGRQVAEHRRAEPPGRRGKGRRRSASGWDPARGRLVIDTPYTQGVAGWIGGEPASFAHLEFATENPFAVLVATSISDEPIATTEAAAGLRDRPGRADRLPLGRRLEARGRRPGPAALPPGAGHGQGRLAAQGNGAGLRPRQHGERIGPVPARDTSRAARAFPADRRQDRRLPLGTDRRMIA